MLWIIEPTIKTEGAAGVDWCRRYLANYDTANVEWLRIDRGRERPGERAPVGIYGRCWYPCGRGKMRRGFRISCQVPGPWPHNVRLRRPPIYVKLTRYWGPRPDHVLDGDGSAVFQFGQVDGVPFWDVADVPHPIDGLWAGQGARGLEFTRRDERHSDQTAGTAWWKTQGFCGVENLSEAIVWLVGHEAFHFLRRSRQIPGRNVEHEADAAGCAALAAFRYEVNQGSQSTGETRNVTL